MKIGNPLYDIVFKFLMSNKPCAIIVLEVILHCKILQLEFSSPEYTTKGGEDNPHPRILRLDFRAQIRTESGEIQNVTIELQKVFRLEDVFRFRQYLATQYRDKNNQNEIVCIYIIGTNLSEALENAMVYVRGQLLLCRTEEVKTKPLEVRLFNHESYFIQLGKLPKVPSNRFERVFAVFDQRNKDKVHAYWLNIDEATFDAEALILVTLLQQIPMDSHLTLQLELEQEYFAEKEANIRNLSLIEVANQRIEAAEQRAAEDRQMAAAARRIAAEERQKAAESDQKAEVERQKAAESDQKAESERQKTEAANLLLLNIAKTLQAQGKSLSEIAEMMGVSEAVLLAWGLSA